MPSLAAQAVSVALSPARRAAALALGVPMMVGELPALVRNLRVLTGELARLSGERGALADVVENLARLSSEDGELTRLLREAARLLAARADQTAMSPAPRGRSRSAAGGGR